MTHSIDALSGFQLITALPDLPSPRTNDLFNHT